MSENIQRDLKDLIMFAVVHGHTLKNHLAFAEMASVVESELKKLIEERDALRQELKNKTEALEAYMNAFEGKNKQGE